MSEVEIPQKRRVGRPKTLNIDKKEYQKQYYKKNRESLLEKNKEYYTEHKDEIRENQKEYIETLKETNPNKYQEIKKKKQEQGNLYTKRSLEVMKLLKEMLQQDLVPESYKNKVLELVN